VIAHKNGVDIYCHCI